jgi:hypothetical protein
LVAIALACSRHRPLGISLSLPFSANIDIAVIVVSSGDEIIQEH